MHTDLMCAVAREQVADRRRAAELDRLGRDVTSDRVRATRRRTPWRALAGSVLVPWAHRPRWPARTMV